MDFVIVEFVLVTVESEFVAAELNFVAELNLR